LLSKKHEYMIEWVSGKTVGKKVERVACSGG
jgi:hypothetical protein